MVGDLLNEEIIEYEFEFLVFRQNTAELVIGDVFTGAVEAV